MRQAALPSPSPRRSSFSAIAPRPFAGAFFRLRFVVLSALRHVGHPLAERDRRWISRHKPLADREGRTSWALFAYDIPRPQSAYNGTVHRDIPIHLPAGQSDHIDTSSENGFAVRHDDSNFSLLAMNQVFDSAMPPFM